MCLYRSVCVRPVRKPHCWFSHEAAHFLLHQLFQGVQTILTDQVVRLRAATVSTILCVAILTGAVAEDVTRDGQEKPV